MEYTNFIDPQMLILIPVLLTIGKFIKSSERIGNKYIPSLLGLTGIVLGSLWTIKINGGLINISIIVSGTIQGILCSGAAVYANQVWKHSKE